uniref:Uncharacterized protein n=1 Tax=Magallana gigas TaxID=29159 RepID=A0A8W8J070_MAGGI
MKGGKHHAHFPFELYSADDGTSDGIQCSTDDAATRHDGSEANGIAVRAHHIPIRIHSERYEIHLVTIIQVNARKCIDLGVSKSSIEVPGKNILPKQRSRSQMSVCEPEMGRDQECVSSPWQPSTSTFYSIHI